MISLWFSEGFSYSSLVHVYVGRVFVRDCQVSALCDAFSADLGSEIKADVADVSRKWAGFHGKITMF